MSDTKTQLAIIGAGPGGYAAAFLAADLGLQVTLIDPEANPGGVCLYRGCIPSKTLLHAAHLVQDARNGEQWGLTFKDLAVDVDALRQRKDRVVAQLTEGLGQLVKRRKITYIRGTAVFKDDKTLEVKALEGEKSTLRFENAVIATGSRAVSLPCFAEAGERVLDATAALDLEDIPDRLLVVGGGYIGLELGSVYAGLGSKVCLVEMMPELLPGVDRDLVRFLQKRLQGLFDDIQLEATVTAVKEQKNGVMVTLKDKEGEGHRTGFSTRSWWPWAAVPGATGWGWRPSASRRTTRVSSVLTISGAPAWRTSMPSAMWPVSPCWPTRRPTKGAWPWR
jgi:dihydrolipoamide dehydrogenase